MASSSALELEGANGSCGCRLCRVIVCSRPCQPSEAESSFVKVPGIFKTSVTTIAERAVKEECVPCSARDDQLARVCIADRVAAMCESLVVSGVLKNEVGSKLF